MLFMMMRNFTQYLKILFINKSKKMMISIKSQKEFINWNIKNSQKFLKVVKNIKTI